MSSNQVIVLYKKEWALIYQVEAQKLKQVFGDFMIDLQHIGSTSIPDISARPIIDIAVLIESAKDADSFIKPLGSLEYEFDPEKSSSERHFFRKYQDQSFHLSIGYCDKGDFWERQLFFRDYLRDHEDTRKEYEDLKLRLLQQDPTASDRYISGKTEFVNKVLNKR